jgi:hypothetical protein
MTKMRNRTNGYSEQTELRVYSFRRRQLMRLVLLVIQIVAVTMILWILSRTREIQ